MSQNLFRGYSRPIGGPGLTEAAYAMPKDPGLLRVGLVLPVEPLPPLASTPANQLTERKVSVSSGELSMVPHGPDRE